jgi:hypothetical protein
MVHPVLLFQMLDEAIITHNALSDRDKDWTKKEFKKIWEILSEYDGINPKKYRNEKLAAINASTPMPPKANAKSQRRAAQAQMLTFTDYKE